MSLDLDYWELKNRIFKDLERLGLPTDLFLEFRSYSKNLDGFYKSKSSNIVVYIYEYPQGNTLKDYQSIICTVIHEAIHLYQWEKDPNFVRLKGVMHNSQFKSMFNHYWDMYLTSTQGDIYE